MHLEVTVRSMAPAVLVDTGTQARDQGIQLPTQPRPQWLTSTAPLPFNAAQPMRTSLDPRFTHAMTMTLVNDGRRPRWLSPRRWQTGALALALTAVLPGVARAQSVCPAQQRADQAKDEGLRLRRDGHDDAALLLFRQSYGLCHGARALVRMAAAEGALGQWVEADAHLREGSTSNDPWVVANRAHIETDRQTVAGHIGTLELLGTGPAATVLIDGHPAGTWPTQTPLRVLAGTVTFTVQAGGYIPMTRTVTVPPRTTDREQVTLVPAPVAVPVHTETPTVVVAQPTPHPLPVESQAAPQRRDPGNSTLRALGWVSAVGAVAGLATGIVASVVRLNQSNGARDVYQQDPACHDDHGTSAYCNGLLQAWTDAGTGMLPVQIAGFTAAGVLAVTSVVLLVAGASHDEARRSVAWRCGGGPGMVGVRCGMTFP